VPGDSVGPRVAAIPPGGGPADSLVPVPRVGPAGLNGANAMPNDFSRRGFVAATAAALLTTRTGLTMTPDDKPSDKPADKPSEPVRDYPAPKFQPKLTKPFLDLTLARDFVIFAHYDLDMVKKLLAKEPALALAVVDWGAGDYESGLGGASHLGNRDIASYLLEHGARMDVFCAAMLGLTDVVKGMLTAAPKLIDAKGPHGISLHLHAKMGGEPAAETLEYLQGVKKVEFPAPPMKK